MIFELPLGITIPPPPVITYIYRFHNRKNNKNYIGKTKNVAKRIEQHITGEGSKSLLLDLVKYGIKKFDISLLEQLATNENELINKIEDFYIEKYDAITNGYNKCLNREPQTVDVDVNNVNIKAKYIGGNLFTVGLKSQYLSYEKLSNLSQSLSICHRVWRGFSFYRIKIEGITNITSYKKNNLYDLKLKFENDRLIKINT